MRYCLIGLVMFLFLSGGYSSQNSKNQKISKFNKSPKYTKYKLDVKQIMTIGSNDLKKENYLMGRVADFAIDREDNIYICDDINIEVKKFSKDGQYIQTLSKGEGKGPGEFIRPRIIRVDSSNHVFVLDQSLKRITEFSSDGEVLKITMIKTLVPGNFLISKGVAYVVGFFIYGTPPVQIIDLNNGELIDAFGSRSKDSLLVSRIGNCGRIDSDNNGHIYYAGYYPYRISVFSSEGEEMIDFSRKASFIKPPVKIRDKTTGQYYMSSQGGIREIVYFGGEYLMALVEKCTNKKGHPEKVKITQILDLFDKSGTWLLSIHIAEYFDNPYTRRVKFDEEGNIYMTVDEPFPQVVKYSFKLRDKNGNDILVK